MTSAGIVKIMPATSDSPAEAAVCTMLFSRIVERRNRRRMPIDAAAAGIDADTVVFDGSDDGNDDWSTADGAFGTQVGLYYDDADGSDTYTVGEDVWRD